jgi:hypothetical protein
MTTRVDLDALREVFGEPIYTYTRQQAVEDGMLADVTAWAAEVGFRCPVVLTAKLWAALEDVPDHAKGVQSLRGRAHDVLWMARLVAPAAVRQGSADFAVLIDLRDTRTRRQTLRLVLDGEAATIGFREDEW